MDQKTGFKMTAYCLLYVILTAALLIGYKPFAALAADAVSGNDKSGGVIFEYLNDVPGEETVYTAGGGQVIWEPVLKEGKVTGGTLTLKNAVITNDTGMGINFPVPVEIRVEGENQITSSSIGIYLGDRETAEPLDLNISGSGSLKITSMNNGIQTAGNIVIDTVRTEIIYGSSSDSFSGLITTKGNITIKNSSFVKIADHTGGVGSNSSAINAGQNRGQTVSITDSHVIAVCKNGVAVNANTGSIELVSSDVRAIGNTNENYASGSLTFWDQCILDGGTLYAQNIGSDLEIPSVPTSPLIGKNNAVLYGTSGKGLPLEGDLVLYVESSYDESGDKVTVTGNGFVMGDVTWNDNMEFGAGKIITVGYRDKEAALTVPEGITLDIPENSGFSVGNSRQLPKSKLINHGTVNIKNKASINVFPDSAVTSHGTVNVLDGGGIYNYYLRNTGPGGLIQNEGKIAISANGVLQNQNRLENSGTIDAAGNFSTVLITGYNAVIENTGTINGFVREMHDGSYTYAANGETVLKSGQTLTLGDSVTSSGASIRLKVAAGAKLVVEEGAVVDARTHVTPDTVPDYIDLEETMTVNGELWLPEEISDENVSQIKDKVNGSGEIKAGDITKHIVVVKNGEKSETQFMEEGSQVSLPENPVREGYVFDGWYIEENGVLKPFDAQAQIQQSVVITAKWTVIKEDPPEETKDPSEETKDPSEETKDPSEETKDPTEETKNPPEETKKPTEDTKNPPEETKKPTEETRQPAQETKKPAVKVKNPASINNKAKVSLSSSKLKVTWSKVSGVKGYDIYAAKCGSNMKLVKSVKGNTKTFKASINRIGKKKISNSSTYKVRINAYCIVNGKKVTVAKSLTYHVVGKNRRGYTNAKSIKIAKTNVTLKLGKTKKIKPKTVKQIKKKKLLPKKHVAAYRYYSTNKKVATVSKAGTVKAKGKGKCTVYAVAANGVKEGVKITVK